MNARLIALDWGTSSFRAWLLGDGGDILEEIPSGPGIMAIAAGEFGTAFASLISPWLARWPELPVIASGMITSRNGWVETPYLPLPLDAKGLANSLTRHVLPDGTAIHFTGGAVKNPDHGMPDVMRGEEVEIFGHLAGNDRADGMFILPGTHNKWVRVTNGVMSDFQTCMTGEIFALLCKDSILGRLATDGPADPGAFRRGVETGLAEGSLMSRLFSARSLALMGRLEGDDIKDYLSGLLIGDELSAQFPLPEAPVTIIGRGDLAGRYADAIAQIGGKAEVAPPGMARAGLWKIAKLAGMVK